MTSNTSNNTSIPQAPTINSTASNQSAHQRTSSLSSGQNSSPAAVTASAPTPRSVSYAARAAQPANTSSKLVSPPVIAATPSSSSVGGAPVQNVRPGSTASTPVNGKISPAVGNAGAGIANGAPTPYTGTGGQHSRKPSVASGARGPAIPNGTQRINISFGTLNDAGTAPSSGPANAATNPSLTAPMAPNPRASSPQPPASAASQPAASGGAPPVAPATSGRGNIQFGDATQGQNQRPTSMPPQAPGSMLNHGHHRRDSAQSAHTETGSPQIGHGRGIPGGRGRNQGYGAGQYPQQQHYGGGSGYGRGGGYPGPNQPRGGPANMGPQYQGPGPGNNYQNRAHRAGGSPAIPHASPSLPSVQPITTNQLYPGFMPPPPAGQHYGMSGQMPGHMGYPMDSGYYGSGYLYHPMSQGYGSMQQTSPRPSFQQISSPVPPYIQPFPQGAPPMSRSSSTNMDMHSARPNSSLGQPPTPSHTPQPINIQPPAPQHASNTYAYPQKKRTYKVEIKNPVTGTVVHYDEVKSPSTTPPVVPSAPLIVSSPSPAPSRAAPRDSPHARSASKAKSQEEKREEMRVSVHQKKMEEQRKQEEQMLEKQRLEAEKAAKEEQERLAKEAEERKKREEEERLKKEEEKLRKEAEERAREEERMREAEAARIAKEKEEEVAREATRIAREKEEEAARIKAEAERKKAKEEEEAKAKAEAEAKAAEALKISSTPTISKPFTPDSETMPPPASRVVEKGKPKPSPLNLQIKTNEPGPPSAALTSLRSARFIDDINSVNYPANILSPNPALNPLASGKFKYAKDFLMQFKDVFTEKPSVDWDQKMRETVGEPDSARPQTTRNTGGGMGPRGSTPRTAASSAQPPMGAMGMFGSFKTATSMITSNRGFERSSTTGSLPPGGLIFNSRSGSGGGGGGGSGLMRTGSSTSLSGGNTPASPRIGNRSQRGSSRKGGGAPMEKTESKQGSGGQPTIPLAEVKPLPVSENRWKPPSATKAAESAAVATPSEDNRLSPEVVQRKVKAALNKMTPEKFDKISDQILEITSQSKYETDGRTLRQVIQLTFEKATDEAAWSSMYAKFCKRMLEAMDPSIKDENIKDRNDNLVTGGSLFRKYLLNRCQEEFERGWKVNLPPKPEGVSDEAAMLSDEYYIAAAAKRRGLGLVQFIGELFKLGMLTERIMNECVRKLLDFEGVPEDETVESLVKLLRTIGRALDASEKSKSMMDMYFARIKLLINDKDLNSRMRFMLMDVIDLRSKEWETKETDKGPKTIQEVREDALKAQQEKEAASRANQRSRPGGGGRGGDTRSFSGGGYGNNNMHHQGGWQDNSKVNTSDLEKLSARVRQSNRGAPSTFGPPGLYPRSASGSGSRRGIGPSMSRGEDSHSSSRTATPAPPTSSKNPYSLLGESHHDSGETNETASPPPSTTSSPPTASSRIRSPPLTNEETK